MINEIKKLFKKSNPDFYINSILDLGEYYVINLQKETSNSDDFILDSLYKLDKKTRKISSFTLEENRKAYLKALNNPFYLKSRDESLSHYGTPRHSGRYPWGSGDRPKQRLEGKKNKKKSKKEDDDDFLVSGSRAINSARGSIKKKKKSKKEDKLAKLNKSAKSFSEVESKTQNVSNDISKAYNTLYNSKYKNVNRARDLSDEDLRNAINRIQLEQRYNDLTMPPKHQGYDRTMAALSVLGSIAGLTSTGISIVAGVQSLKKK